MEILNLARFVSVMKYSTVSWRMNHPFIMPDRYENDTSSKPMEDEAECNISFYGYIRGCSYRMNNKIHIVGLGDYEIEKMETLDDPCP